jgi:hypothetical protein
MMAALFVAPSFAECVKPGPAPAVPHGATASEAEMKAGRQALQAHVDLLQSYQSCLAAQAAQAPADTAPELKATWLAQGDAALDVAQTEAATFSTELQLFRAKNGPAPDAKK